MASFLGDLVSRALGSPLASCCFTLGEKLGEDVGSLWMRYKGTKKDDGTPLTVFFFDCVKKKDKRELASNALKRFKQMRHPTLLKYIDGVETEKEIYIATESVQPLSTLPKDSLILQWGLYSLVSAIHFINTDCALVHGNLLRSSVFVTPAGEWKLGGWDLCCSLQEDNPIFVSTALKWVDDKYLPPEVRKASWPLVKSNPPFVVDAWMFGTLIYEIFNGVLPRQDGFSNGSIPPQLLPVFHRLVADDPRQRPSMPLLETNPFFHHPLVHTVKFLDQIALKDKPEKEEFIKHLQANVDQLPPAFKLHKVLPEIANALEFGGIGPPALNLVLSMGKTLQPPEYEKHIVPIIIRAFAMPDRSVRVTLCNSLVDFIDLLSENVVNDKVWSHFAAGFVDIHALVREATLRAILSLLPKLSTKILNGDVVNYLGKLQTDEEAGIRTNAVVCLGKIVPNLSATTVKKVLIPGLIRALKDPFPPARHAGLLALAASSKHFTSPEVAQQLIPAIGPLLVDPDKKTRMTAVKTINSFIKKLAEEAENMVAAHTSSSNVNGVGVAMSQSASLPGALPFSSGNGRAASAPPPPSNPLIPAVQPSLILATSGASYNSTPSSEAVSSFGRFGITALSRTTSPSSLKLSNSATSSSELAFPPPPKGPKTSFATGTTNGWTTGTSHGTNASGGMSLPASNSQSTNGWGFDDFENDVLGNRQPVSTRASTSTLPNASQSAATQNQSVSGSFIPTAATSAAPAMPSAWDNWDDSF
ncbi:hypothetical protein SeLEV6574_g03948 [Synchytrium endobioticum]|uniref:Protein kinase domain-containing protein n=2 Tax=Synchytrium endobioticum TaxID=286115 RepID=A0A507D1F5_9FUNG|nr:hypothetical protein SeLEV6574_g03948 [Synchytrium endobioticum]